MPRKKVVTINQFPSRDDATISASIRALADGRGLDKVAIAAACDLTKDQLYDRLRGDIAWKASEVGCFARHLDVRISDLYDGLGGRVGPPPDGPLAQSVELRTFNPKGRNGDLAKVFPFRPRQSPQDVSIAIGS